MIHCCRARANGTEWRPLLVNHAGRCGGAVLLVLASPYSETLELELDLEVSVHGDVRLLHAGEGELELSDFERKLKGLKHRRDKEVWTTVRTLVSKMISEGDLAQVHVELFARFCDANPLYAAEVEEMLAIQKEGRFVNGNRCQN